MNKFALVSAERANHAVTTLCRVIGVSVSGFYAWLAELRGHIGRIFTANLTMPFELT
jgi:putative transposase